MDLNGWTRITWKATAGRWDFHILRNQALIIHKWKENTKTVLKGCGMSLDLSPVFLNNFRPSEGAAHSPRWPITLCSQDVAEGRWNNCAWALGAWAGWPSRPPKPAVFCRRVLLWDGLDLLGSTGSNRERGEAVKVGSKGLSPGHTPAWLIKQAWYLEYRVRLSPTGPCILLESSTLFYPSELPSVLGQSRCLAHPQPEQVSHSSWVFICFLSESDFWTKEVTAAQVHAAQTSQFLQVLSLRF